MGHSRFGPLASPQARCSNSPRSTPSHDAAQTWFRCGRLSRFQQPRRVHRSTPPLLGNAQDVEFARLLQKSQADELVDPVADRLLAVLAEESPGAELFVSVFENAAARANRSAPAPCTLRQTLAPAAGRRKGFLRVTSESATSSISFKQASQASHAGFQGLPKIFNDGAVAALAETQKPSMPSAS
jgi:hypothetical protein